MMRRVVGLDLSLTKTGIGIVTYRPDREDCIAVVDTIISRGKRADDLVARHTRITELGKQIVHHAATADLALIEGVSMGGKQASPLDRNGLWWFVVGALIRRDVPIAVVSPASLKLAIASSGRADKATVAVALSRLWPEVDVTSSDVADALGLAHLGAVWLRWPVKTLERHRAVKAAWPELMSTDEIQDGAA